MFLTYFTTFLHDFEFYLSYPLNREVWKRVFSSTNSHFSSDRTTNVAIPYPRSRKTTIRTTWNGPYHRNRRISTTPTTTSLCRRLRHRKTAQQLTKPSGPKCAGAWFRFGWSRRVGRMGRAMTETWRLCREFFLRVNYMKVNYSRIASVLIINGKHNVFSV